MLLLVLGNVVPSCLGLNRERESLGGFIPLHPYLSYAQGCCVDEDDFVDDIAVMNMNNLNFVRAIPPVGKLDLFTSEYYDVFAIASLVHEDSKHVVTELHLNLDVWQCLEKALTLKYLFRHLTKFVLRPSEDADSFEWNSQLDKNLSTLLSYLTGDSAPFLEVLEVDIRGVREVLIQDRLLHELLTSKTSLQKICLNVELHDTVMMTVLSALKEVSARTGHAYTSIEFLRCKIPSKPVISAITSGLKTNGLRYLNFSLQLSRPVLAVEVQFLTDNLNSM